MFYIHSSDYMKAISILVFLLMFVPGLDAQNYEQRVQENLKRLIKDESLKDYFTIDSTGIYLFASPDDKKASKVEFHVSWTGIPELIKKFDRYSRSEMLAYYLQGDGAQVVSKITLGGSKTRTGLKGLRIALDPGHMAENRRQAKWEKRYMRIKKGGFFSGSYRFYEAELAYATAYLLRQLLEDAGAEVMISREKDANTFGIPFKKWLRNEFKTSITEDLAKGELDTAYFQWLNEVASKEEIYRTYFRKKEFERRIEKINSWKPDLTLIIHYNAGGHGTREAIDENYCMAFVAGSFAEGELKKPQDRVDFLRLLISDDIERSEKLAGELVLQHQKILAIPPVPGSLESDIAYLKNYSIRSEYPGVYSRNLIMTRGVKGVLAFGESLLQENIDEAKLLSKKDFEDNGIRTSTRVYEVAQAYYRAVMELYSNQGKTP